MWWRKSNCSILLIYRPRQDERLTWPGLLTYSGRLTHISGHPSVTGRPQDGERTMARDWRSTAEPRRPTLVSLETVSKPRRRYRDDNLANAHTYTAPSLYSVRMLAWLCFAGCINHLKPTLQWSKGVKVGLKSSLQVAQLWPRDRAKLDTFSTNVQRYPTPTPTTSNARCVSCGKQRWTWILTRTNWF